MVLCSVVYLSKTRSQQGKEPLHCLDAFGATGISGMVWKKRLKTSGHVTICERNAQAFSNLRENLTSNGFQSVDLPVSLSDPPGLPLAAQSTNEIHVKKCDANVLMRLAAFDFIYVDPFGCSVPYLMSALTHITNGGVLFVTSTDISSLLCLQPRVTMRNYGVRGMKTEYTREFGVRMVVAAIVRAAAICNKGIEVLLSFYHQHYICVAVRVVRGTNMANNTVQSVKSLVHCVHCGERAFVDDNVACLAGASSASQCDCHVTSPGSSMLLGPVWSGAIFDVGVLHEMELISKELKLAECHLIIGRLIGEAMCVTARPKIKGESKVNIAVATVENMDLRNCESKDKSKNDVIDDSIKSESNVKTAVEILDQGNYESKNKSKNDVIDDSIKSETESNVNTAVEILDQGNCESKCKSKSGVTVDSVSTDDSGQSMSKQLSQTLEESSPKIETGKTTNALIQNDPIDHNITVNVSKRKAEDETEKASKIAKVDEKSDKRENHIPISDETIDNHKDKLDEKSVKSEDHIPISGETIDNDNDAKLELTSTVEDTQENSESKTTEINVNAENSNDLPCPPFYYDLTWNCRRRCTQPKLRKLVKALRNRGNRASRTHFCDSAIRTDIPLRDLVQVLSDMAAKSKT